MHGWQYHPHPHALTECEMLSSYLNSQYFFDLSLQTSLPEVCYSEVVQDDAGLWKYVYPHKQEFISLV